MVNISIITVTYNSEKYIKETIESVLSQKEFLHEYLIIDAKSTDSTIDIVQEYAPLFNGKLRWISEPDKGIYDAMNKGITNSKGNVIGIINSDDSYTNSALKYVKEAFENNNNLGVIYSDLNVISEKGKYISKIIAKLSDINIGMCLNHPTCFVKREIYDSIGNYNIKYKIAADYDFAIRVIKSECKLHKFPMPLANFRVGGASDISIIGIMDTYKIQKIYFNKLYATYIYIKNLTKYNFKVWTKIRF